MPSGIKWANKNIGAQTVEDYGTYFSCGNTDGYTASTKFFTVDEACQLFSSFTGETITTKEELEYMLSRIGLTVDNLGIVDGYSFDDATYNGTTGAGFTGDVLDSTHDAATVNMDDSWRMPTNNEYEELVNAIKSSDGTKGTLTCQYEYIDLNGEQQSLVVYKNDMEYVEFGFLRVEGLIIDGSPIFKTFLGIRFTNDATWASVYFPACGAVTGPVLICGGYGRYSTFSSDYWSSSISVITGDADSFSFSPKQVGANSNNDYFYGLCVRAVK